MKATGSSCCLFCVSDASTISMKALKRTNCHGRFMKNDEVGYCRPPTKHRWKKGQSGNPKGRPRKAPPSIDDAEILRRLDAEVIRVGAVSMPRREAELRRILASAIGRNRKARALLNRLAKSQVTPIGGGVVRIPMAEFDRIER